MCLSFVVLSTTPKCQEIGVHLFFLGANSGRRRLDHPRFQSLNHFLMSNFHSPLREVSLALTAEADVKGNKFTNGAGPRGVITNELRESLFSSISNTSHPLPPANTTTQHHDLSAQHHLPHRQFPPAGDPGSPSGGRPDSPYTLNPPIDYDGLSWPSVGAKARKEATPEQKAATMEKLTGA